MQLIDPRFDIVDGIAQAAFETGLLIQPDTNFLFDDGAKMRLVLRQRAAHRFDLTRQIGLAGGHDLSVKHIDIGNGGFADLNLAVGPLLIVAEQKVLFRPAAFQQFDADLAVSSDRVRALSAASR